MVFLKVKKQYLALKIGKNRMSGFKNINPRVSSYIEGLPEHQQPLAEAVRGLIYTLQQPVEERFSFGIPFYHLLGMFCYINPIEGGIELGFCRGKDLVLAYPQLEMGNRAMVAGVKLYQLKDIQRKEIMNLLEGAAAWQVEAAAAKRKFVAAKKKKKK